MSDPVPDIQHEVVVEAPLARVWRAMTEGDEVAAWLGCLEFEARVGHTFYMQPDTAKRQRGDLEGATHCEIVSIEPEKRLVFSWFFPDTPKTHVTLELAPEGPNTRVTLTHTGWDKFPPDVIRPIRDGLEGGWKSGALPGLAAHVKGG